jgi:hypothetical protein
MRRANGANDEEDTAIRALLQDQYDSHCPRLRASNFIAKQFPVPPDSSPQERAHHLIEKSNCLHEKYGNGILAELALLDISVSASAQSRSNPSAISEAESNGHLVRFGPYEGVGPSCFPHLRA